jgi:hypothetical protein
MTYPVWLRLATLLIIFAAIFLAAKWLGFGRAQDKATINKSGASAILLGLCICLVTLPVFIASLTSAKRTVSGTIEDLSYGNTRHGRYWTFTVRGLDGSAQSLNTDDTSEPLANGQRVLVAFRDFPRDILDLSILDGPHAGYIAHNEEHPLVWTIPLAVGVIVLLIGVGLRVRFSKAQA